MRPNAWPPVVLLLGLAACDPEGAAIDQYEQSITNGMVHTGNTAVGRIIFTKVGLVLLLTAPKVTPAKISIYPDAPDGGRRCCS